MPKIVDHEQRRRQITDAVCRITLRGGLGAATFRQVAAEAGVSVRLVQYYFGTKAGLVDTTLKHVGERSIARLLKWVDDTDGSPRAVLEAFLKSFAPIDEESRTALLMYTAIYTESVVASLDGGGAPEDREREVEMMRDTVLEQLRRGELAEGVDAVAEADLITALMPGLGQYVLDGTISAQDAFDTIGYHLDRIFVDDASADASHPQPR